MDPYSTQNYYQQYQQQSSDINPYHQPISKAVIPVPAGAQVTAEWHHSMS